MRKYSCEGNTNLGDGAHSLLDVAGEEIDDEQFDAVANLEVGQEWSNGEEDEDDQLTIKRVE